MAPAVYIMVALTTLACAVLLLRGYGRSRARLLLWSSICFFGLSTSNALVFVDLVLFPEYYIYIWRLLTAAAGMGFLMYGLIWENK
jgi:hypothetical protein